MTLSALKRKVDWSFSIVFSLLIGGNVFFVKRLINTIDSLTAQVEQLQVQVSVIDSRLGILLKDAAAPLKGPRVQLKKKI